MSTLNNSPAKNFGITEAKKAAIDEMGIQVLNAQYNVDQWQAIVTSLTEKSQKLQTALALADSARAQSLSNRDLLDSVTQQALDVLDNSTIAFNETALADVKTRNVAVGIKNLADQLIYSAEVVNKLSAMIVRRKALNPLIPDELISAVTQAGADANNAVAQTLVALQSTFTTQAALPETASVAALEHMQAKQLYQALTGGDGDVTTDKRSPSGLKTLLYDAYLQANEDREQILKANDKTTQQLNEAVAQLNAAQTKLQALQSAYAAASAS